MNNQNNEVEKDECPFCDAYEEFTQGIRDGVPSEEAFHEALQTFADKMNDDLFEVYYDKGYNDGFVSSLRHLSHMTDSMADEIVDRMDREECGCDECDCENDQ